MDTLPDKETPFSIPIACRLTGAALDERRAEIAPLFDMAERVRELPDGYAFRFAGTDAAWQGLVAFIAAERDCCPFVRFGLIAEPGQGPLWLQLLGNEDVKAFAREMFVAPLGLIVG